VARKRAPNGSSGPDSSNAAGPHIESIARPTARRTVIRFRSNPPGAEVRQVGIPGLLGITPFDHSFDRPGPRGPQRLNLEMRMPGYEPQRFSVELAQDAFVDRTLTKAIAPAPPPAPARRPARKKANREGTLDPFGP
jgi:hypothetical protein